jgi:hypothetical protein
LPNFQEGIPVDTGKTQRGLAVHEARLREDLGGFLGEASSADTFWVEALVSKSKRGMIICRRR